MLAINPCSESALFSTRIMSLFFLKYNVEKVFGYCLAIRYSTRSVELVITGAHWHCRSKEPLGWLMYMRASQEVQKGVSFRGILQEERCHCTLSEKEYISLPGINKDFDSLNVSFNHSAQKQRQISP